MTNQDTTEAFRRSLADGKVLIHPTDTIAGLTCDPHHPSASQRLLALKGYDQSRPLIGLAANTQVALRCFLDLPSVWAERLARTWPAPLTVVWRASTHAPQSIVGSDGTIAIRVPVLPPAADWFAKILDQMGGPLPSTSINLKGAAAATTWEACENFAQTHKIFLPPQQFLPIGVSTLPSTIIAPHADGTFTVLRPGAIKL